MRRNRKNRQQSPLVIKSKKRADRIGRNIRRNRMKMDFSKASPVIILVGELLAVIVLAFFVVDSFGLRLEIVGESMEPTLVSGDEVLINRFSYRVGSPKADDMVAFYPKGNRGAAIMVKRIIALPGDTVRIENGAVYVNDLLIDDVAKTDFISDAGVAAEEITIPEGEYFCLGDNRNNSEDSRFESIGNLTEDMIVGKVWLKVTKGNLGMVQ